MFNYDTIIISSSKSIIYNLYNKTTLSLIDPIFITKLSNDVKIYKNLDAIIRLLK